MKRLSTLTATVTIATALAGSASAETFGQQVATCAHELGARDDAPAVTCTHNGTTMTFATSGAMVEHMRATH